MADGAVVHIGENSPEHVALKLAHQIMEAEGYTVSTDMAQRTGKKLADRAYILRAYFEASQVVRGYEPKT